MFNTFPQVCLVYDRYHKASTERKASVEVRITYNKKQKYISTGVAVFSNQWKKDKVVNCSDAVYLNNIIDTLVTSVKQALHKMYLRGSIDIYKIMEEIKEETITFIDYCKERSSFRKYNKTTDTQKRYDRFLKDFISYGKIVTFNDITEKNIIEYDRYLEGKGLKPYSKWNNYHRFLNSFILDGINDGYIKRNPYKWINIFKDKSTSGIGKYLSPVEFYKIRKAVMPTQSLEKVRDIFTFQTYTCLSYSDLKRFDVSKLEKVKGMWAYIDNRKKTHKTFTIPILPQAMKILEKYDYKLPVISNVKYNEYLKIVAQAAGIDKPISSHWARHTGATLLLNEGVEMKIISRICGHSSIRITEQIYAKLLDETVVKAVQDLDI